MKRRRAASTPGRESRIGQHHGQQGARHEPGQLVGAPWRCRWPPARGQEVEAEEQQKEVGRGPEQGRPSPSSSRTRRRRNRGATSGDRVMGGPKVLRGDPKGIYRFTRYQAQFIVNPRPEVPMTVSRRESSSSGPPPPPPWRPRASTCPRPRQTPREEDPHPPRRHGLPGARHHRDRQARPPGDHVQPRKTRPNSFPA